MTAARPSTMADAASALLADGPIHRAADLLAGSDTARIVLDDRVYTLRLTRAGKLILTR